MSPRVVVEVSARYNGGPWQYAVQLLEFRDDKVARERIYVMEGWDALEWPLGARTLPTRQSDALMTASTALRHPQRPATRHSDQGRRRAANGKAGIEPQRTSNPDAGAPCSQSRPSSKATTESGEKFLYELKAGPAGGRLRRPSSVGSTSEGHGIRDRANCAVTFSALR